MICQIYYRVFHTQTICSACFIFDNVQNMWWSLFIVWTRSFNNERQIMKAMLVPSAKTETTDPTVAHRQTHREHLEHIASYLPTLVNGSDPKDFLVTRPASDTRLALEVVGRDGRFTTSGGTVIALRDGKVGIVPPQHKHESWAQPFLR